MFGPGCRHLSKDRAGCFPKSSLKNFGKPQWVVESWFNVSFKNTVRVHVFSLCRKQDSKTKARTQKREHTEQREGGRRKGRKKGERGREGGTESILAPDSDSNFSWQNSRHLFRYIVPRKVSI